MIHTRYKTSNHKSSIDVLNLNQQKSQNMKWFVKQFAYYSRLYHKAMKHNQICILFSLLGCLMLQAMAQLFVATEILLFSVAWKFSQDVWKSTNTCKKRSSSTLHAFGFRLKLQKQKKLQLLPPPFVLLYENPRTFGL